MTRIKAAVTHGFGQPFQIEEVDLRAPLPGEVEVTLDAVAICHSDISYADGIWGGTLPAIYGHEAAGRITAIGDDVRGVALGDRVIVTLIRACGACAGCAAGRPVACETPPDPDRGPLTALDGTSIHQAMNCGAFAERVIVDRSQIAPIPDAMPAPVACLLACGVITGIGAVVNGARLRPGQDAVVIGAGGVGLNAIQGARLAGARRIVAVDLSEAKLDDARAFGATDTLLATAPDPHAELRRLIGRGADAVFVATGAIAAYNTAAGYLAPGGQLVMVGMPASEAHASYLPGDMAAAGQGMVGSKMGDAVLARDIPWLTDLWAQGRLELDALVSRTWSLEQINEAIADTRSGAARRNVITF